MNDFAEELIIGLLRASAVLSIGVGFVWLLLNCIRVKSPNTQAISWTAVLMLGIVIVPIPVTLEVLPTKFTLDPSGQGDADDGTQHRIVENIEAPSVAVEVRSEVDSLTTGKSAVGKEPVNRIYDLLAITWLAGIAFNIFFCGGLYLIFVTRIRRAGLSTVPQELEDEWSAACDQSGLAQAVPMHTSCDYGPCICHLNGHTRLIVPESWKELPAEQRASILKHEAAHLKRGDLWRGFIYQLMACVQWFNPLSWLCVRKLAECAEWSCDDNAARSADPELTREYVQALMGFSVTSHQAPTTVSAASSHSVVRRARRLLSPEVKEDSTMKKLVSMTALACLVTFGTVDLNLVAGSDETQTPDPSPKTVVTEPVAKSPTDPVVAHREAQSVEQELPKSTANTSLEVTRAVDVVLLDPNTITFTGNHVDIENRTAATGTREAVVDIAYLFKQMPEFERNRKKLQEQLKNAQRQSKLTLASMKLLGEQLKKAEPKNRAAIEKKLIAMRAESTRERQLTEQKLRRAEAESYASTYRQIRKAIADYAKEHDIDIVRRAAVGTHTDDNLESRDLQSVMQAINADVLYVADSNINITDDILALLKEKKNDRSSEEK